MKLTWRLAHLPWLLAAAGAMLVAATVVGWFGRGGVGAAGAALGVAVATVSYLLSTLVIAWADAVRPALVLPLGLASYVGKMGLLGGVMLALADRDWPGLVPMALGVVAGAVAWSAAQIWWVVRRQARPSRQARPPRRDRSPDGGNSPYRTRMGGPGVRPE